MSKESMYVTITSERLIRYYVIDSEGRARPLICHYQTISHEAPRRNSFIGTETDGSREPSVSG